jgi:hypothetical protein
VSYLRSRHPGDKVVVIDYLMAYAKPSIPKIDDLGSRRSGLRSKITTGSFA